jgi:signal recognition particle subunit SRP54
MAFRLPSFLTGAKRDAFILPPFLSIRLRYTCPFGGAWAMWRGLTERLQNLLARWRGRGRLTEEEVDEWLRELRLNLLEADVNLRVARQFVGQLRERLLTPEVLEHPNPSRRMTQIVYEELTRLLGEKPLAVGLCVATADGVFAVGLARFGQDDDLREVGAAFEKARATPFARRRRLETTRRR